MERPLQELIRMGVALVVTFLLLISAIVLGGLLGPKETPSRPPPDHTQPALREDSSRPPAAPTPVDTPTLDETLSQLLGEEPQGGSVDLEQTLRELQTDQSVREKEKFSLWIWFLDGIQIILISALIAGVAFCWWSRVNETQPSPSQSHRLTRDPASFYGRRRR